MTEIIDPTQLLNIGIVSGFYGLLIIMIELFYIVFAFIVTRQIKLMNRSFRTPMAPIFTLMGRLHFLGSFIILLVTILLNLK
jgi:hypothetical protein